MVWRGDCAVVFPSFDMQKVLGAVARYRIQRLYVVSRRSRKRRHFTVYG